MPNKGCIAFKILIITMDVFLILGFRGDSMFFSGHGCRVSCQKTWLAHIEEGYINLQIILVFLLVEDQKSLL